MKNGWRTHKPVMSGKQSKEASSKTGDQQPLIRGNKVAFSHQVGPPQIPIICKKNKNSPLTFRIGCFYVISFIK
jgi:hypothetical protein